MPIYDFECQECGETSENWATVDERTRACSCGGQMARLITSRYNINPGTYDYVEDNLGPNPVRINGREHLERVMRREGVSARSAKGKEWW